MVKNLPANCQCRGQRFDPLVRKILWRRKWQPSPVFLSEEFHGQRSLTGSSPRGPKESDTTERLTLLAFTLHIDLPRTCIRCFFFSLVFIFSLIYLRIMCNLLIKILFSNFKNSFVYICFSTKKKKTKKQNKKKQPCALLTSPSMNSC